MTNKNLERLYSAHGFFSNGSVTDGLLLWRGGSVVYERYADGWDGGTPHNMYSVTKSVVSALAGAAVHEGCFGAKDKVAAYFPDAAIAAGQESKRGMTIEHILQMRSGIQCDRSAWLATLWNPEVTDCAKAVFELPQKSAPGEKFCYNNVAPSLLLGIIERTTGRRAMDYAREKLFAPLGIVAPEWECAADGLPHGSYGLHLTPHDMLALGLLYLHDGVWHGQRILARSWVAATQPKAKTPFAYGYLFWRFNYAPRSAYEAIGQHGQFITICPAKNTVTVRTGSQGKTDKRIWALGEKLGIF